jgi:capsid protein
VLSRAIGAVAIEEYAARPEKFEAVKFKPVGMSYVDPTKEVEAYKEAVKAGFLTRTDVIALTGEGRDIEEVDATREQELAAAAARGLVYDTDPEVYVPPEPQPPAPKETPPPEDMGDSNTTDEPPARLVSFGGRKT